MKKLTTLFVVFDDDTVDVRQTSVENTWEWDEDGVYLFDSKLMDREKKKILIPEPPLKIKKVLDMTNYVKIT